MNHYLSLIYHIFNYRLSRFFNKPFSFPINLTLSVTNICYSRCKTCNVWKIHKKYPDRSKKELKLEEWEKILRSIGKTPIWVTVTGGETMLRADLPDIINHVEKYNKPKYINIATSGIYPEKNSEKYKNYFK